MRRWHPVVLVLVVFAGPESRVRGAALALRAGDAFNCSTSAAMTTFDVKGVKSETALGPTQSLFRILDSEVEETILGRDVPEHLRKPIRYPISSRETGSLFSFYSNGTKGSDRHVIAFHLLNAGTAVLSDTSPGYRNVGGGVTISTESGLCQKVRK